MKTLHDIHKALEAEIDDRRLTIHLHAHEFILCTQFLRTLGRSDGYDGTYVNIGAGDGLSLRGLIVQVHLGASESFKAAAPILDWFLAQGWTPGAQSESADKYWMYREYTFHKTAPVPLFWSHKDLPTQKLQATVRVWPPANSQHCKRVETGVEPTFKLVCEDA